jgi:hypothetical protein
MTYLSVIFLLLTVAPETFSRFSYCRENSRGPFELQCVNLGAGGAGEVLFKRRDADSINVGIQLSSEARDRFTSVVAATNYLEQGSAYESNRKVADLGKKRLTIEMPSGSRESTFNYSSRKEVIELVSFFDALINQETIVFDMDNALQFERLSIPKRLEQVENELRSNRIADPQRLVPMLEKIERDQRLLNFARSKAGRMKEQIVGVSAR